jgi:hypothetical protein
MSTTLVSMRGYVAPPGQVQFTTATTSTWVVPVGVTKISIVCVGAGNTGGSSYTAGGGGALAYFNDVAVTPGETLNYRVGSFAGSTQVSQSSYLRRGASPLCEAGGGNGGDYELGSGPGAGGVVIAGIGGSGGQGGGGTGGSHMQRAGGGGAGGYSGAGGTGGRAMGSGFNVGQAGTGGAGGGGASGDTPTDVYGGGGGGVGIFGSGSSGNGGASSAAGGLGGSSGNNGSGGSVGTAGAGGLYGAGAGQGASGRTGAVRIIWPGNVRQFPSTRTANE